MKTKERGTWKVVSEDAEKTRQPKSISFDLTNPYEVDLLNYAELEDKYFSRYIKRLIDRDKNKTEVKAFYNIVEDIPEEEESDVEDMTSLL